MVSTVVIACLVALAIALVGVRVAGFTPFAVLSGSMEPAYMRGDLVYVAHSDPQTIQVGDTIAFVSDSALQTITHRVAAVQADGSSFTTKGDANNSVDGAPVAAENVLGKVVFSLPKLGFVSAFLTSEAGRWVGVAVVLALVLVLFVVPELVRTNTQERAEKRSPHCHTASNTHRRNSSGAVRDTGSGSFHPTNHRENVRAQEKRGMQSCRPQQEKRP